MKKIFRVGTAFAGVLTLAGLMGTGTATGATPPAPAQLAAYRSPAYSAPGRELRVGMSGSDVKALQQRLNALHYYAGGADGQFGPNTEEAVWAFQEVQGIGVDGIVGPATGHYLARPKPYWPRDPKGGEERVEVNLARQTLVLYKNHRIALVSHVSPAGGYRYCDKNGCSIARTPTGEFHTTGYLPGWVKVPLGKMYNPVFFIGDEYAIHGDTYVPLGKASHGCIRIPMDIAQFFHKMVLAHGTPVFVFK